MRSIVADRYPMIEVERFSALTTCGNSFRPLMLFIETVNICNNDCIFCAYSSQTRSKKTMDMGLFEKIVTDYAAIGGGPVSLTPVVGDVFLDKLFVDRIKFLRRFPEITSISATTNAVMTYLRNGEEFPTYSKT